MTDEEKFAEARAGAHGAVDDLFDNLEGANKLIGELVAVLRAIELCWIIGQFSGDPELRDKMRAVLAKVKEC